MDTLPCEQQGMDPTACERVQELEALLRRSIKLVVAYRRMQLTDGYAKDYANNLLADIEKALTL